MCSWSIVVCLLTFSVLAIPGSQACSCVGVQPFCNALPQRDAKDQVIFVGTVTDSYPKSWAHYAELTQQYLAQSAPGAQVKLGSDIQSLRQAYFGVFGSTLSPDEKAEIGRARTEDELEQALGDLRFSPRRVRLHVRESFVGSRTDEFEVFTGLGGGDCGVGFHEGETWLVVAWRSEKTGRWITSICSRTARIDYATDDLKALRAWKKEETLAPRIYGRVEDWTQRAGPGSMRNAPLAAVALRLKSDQSTRKSVTDESGRFAFDNLKPGKYTLETAFPGWSLSRVSDGRNEIDLSNGGCSELDLLLVEHQGNVRGKLVSPTDDLPKFLWIDLIPVSSSDGAHERSGTSKADGDFIIDEIEPGDYVVALNVLEPPTSKTNRSSRYERISPYPPTYYPGVAERVKATVFHIDRNTTLQLPEWILPAQLKERGLSGTVVWPNGGTVPDARVVLMAVGSNNPMSRRRTVNEGRFEVVALERLTYKIEAAARNPVGKAYYHGSIDIGPELPESIVVVLKPEGSKPSVPSFFDESWDQVRSGREAAASYDLLGQSPNDVDSEDAHSVARDQAQEAYYKADSLARAELWAEALPLLDTSLALKADDPAVLNTRCWVKNGLKKFEEAIRDCNEAIRLDPSYYMAYNNRCWANERLGKYDEALRDCDEAARLNPADYHASYNRANIYADQKQFQKALESYSHAAELAPPGEASPYYGRGQVYEKLHDHPRAIAEYTEAIRRDSRDWRAYNNRATQYYETGQLEKALEGYSDALRVRPTYGLAVLNRALMLIELNRYREAISDCDKAIQLKTEETEAYLARARAYGKLEEFEKGFADYDEVIGRDPNNEEAHRQRGNIRMHLGDFEGAEADFRMLRKVRVP